LVIAIVASQIVSALALHPVDDVSGRDLGLLLISQLFRLLLLEFFCDSFHSVA